MLRRIFQAESSKRNLLGEFAARMELSKGNFPVGDFTHKEL